jgi:hypothetical protein
MYNTKMNIIKLKEGQYMGMLTDSYQLIKFIHVERAQCCQDCGYENVYTVTAMNNQMVPLFMDQPPMEYGEKPTKMIFCAPMDDGVMSRMWTAAMTCHKMMTKNESNE